MNHYNFNYIKLDNKTAKYPATNFDIEMKLLESDKNYIIRYINNNAVVVGRFQNVNQEINHSFVYENDIKIIRRESGGGAVYQDDGNLNISFVYSLNGRVDNKKIAENIMMDMLRKMQIPSISIKRTNIFSGSYKISGSAIYKKGDRVIAHYTLMINVNQEKLQKSLFKNKGYKSRAALSNYSKTINVTDVLNKTQTKIENDIECYLRNNFKETHIDLIRDFNNKTTKIEKYKSVEWVYGCSPNYYFINKGLLNGEYFELMIYTEKGKVKSFESTGSNKDIDLIKLFVIGQYHVYDLLLKKLEDGLKGYSRERVLEINKLLFAA